jgi:hypothetical protein
MTDKLLISMKSSLWILRLSFLPVPKVIWRKSDSRIHGKESQHGQLLLSWRKSMSPTFSCCRVSSFGALAMSTVLLFPKNGLWGGHSSSSINKPGQECLDGYQWGETQGSRRGLLENSNVPTHLVWLPEAPSRELP